jgi:hypothetical protein
LRPGGCRNGLERLTDMTTAPTRHVRVLLAVLACGLLAITAASGTVAHHGHGRQPAMSIADDKTEAGSENIRR